MQVLNMEVPGLNSGKVIFETFSAAGTALLEYLHNMILHLFGLCFTTLYGYSICEKALLR